MPYSANTLRASEAGIHQTIAHYLKLQYPGVIFRSDFAAGIKMTMGQAIKHKSLQHGKSYPDLFIAAPRGKYHGAFLELKRADVAVYLRDGSLSKNAHIQEQATMLDELRRLGYYADFAIGFDDAKAKLDIYLSS